MGKEVEKVLEIFAKSIVKQSRANLTRGKKKDRGELYQSLGYKVKESKNSIEATIFMAGYGDFVDKGVKGVKSQKKAPRSPYKFGTGTGKSGGLTNAINGWVKRRRIQFRDKGTGRFLTHGQTAQTIIRSIWLTGLKTTLFYSKPYEKAFARLPKEVINAYGLDMISFFELNKKNREQ